MSDSRPTFPATWRSGSSVQVQQRAVGGPSPSSKTVATAQVTSKPVSFLNSAQVKLPITQPSIGAQNFDTQRQRMVMHLRSVGVVNEGVLAAMQAVPRHLFVDSALASQAYEDTSLPIGLGQTISKPNVVARLLELLMQDRTTPLGRVLDVGTGCGYQASVLSHICNEVYSIERLRGLHDKAIRNLRHIRRPNIHLLLGDGMRGYPQGAPYAGIVCAAAAQSIPQAWLDQLAVGGRIVCPVHASASNGPAHVPSRQRLMVIENTPQGLVQELLEDVQFVPLKSGVSSG